MLGILVQKRRIGTSAKRFFKRLLAAPVQALQDRQG
ncbi:hypothetical protein [Muricoccus aerilatus]